MAREKPYYREVVADIIERTGKMVLTISDVMRYLKVGHNTALSYMEKGEKTTNVYKLAGKLL